MQERQRSNSSTHSAGKGALSAKHQLWASERLDMTPLGMVSAIHTEETKVPWLLRTKFHEQACDTMADWLLAFTEGTVTRKRAHGVKFSDS